MGRLSKKQVLAKAILEQCSRKDISANSLSLITHLEKRIVEQILSVNVGDIEAAVLEKAFLDVTAHHG